MSTFVLIHGAWHGGWCWEKVKPLLTAQGHQVVAPDLPGHGADQTPVAAVTLAGYVERVCAVINAQAEPVILVGHSMGGVVITQTAEALPTKIKHLVYLAAFLPRHGESLFQLAQGDPASLILPNLIVNEAEGWLSIKKEAQPAAFYQDCNPADVIQAQARLTQKQALAGVGTSVQISALNFGRVPRTYIQTLQDQAVTPALQRQMYTATPCSQLLSLDSGHSPFLSAPAALANHLLTVAQQADGVPALAQPAWV
jgi:pimeloyl-ACP methyl ester carboxylesterase